MDIPPPIDWDAWAWRDVSARISPEMAVWPGDGPVAFVPEARIERGDIANVTRINLPAHTGTHCDAPWHFEDAGKRVDEVDTGVFFGDARILDCTGRDRVRAEDLGDAPLPPRVLLKTDGSARSLEGPFAETFPALTARAAQRLVEEGVRLIGIDYLSIAPFDDPEPVHHILLRANIFVVEGLRLAGIEPGGYPFLVFPMPLAGLSGAPCRAFLGEPARR